MKFTLILLICCFCAIYTVNAWEGRPCKWNHRDGQPACNAAEVTQGKWRNNDDPTAYWLCSTVGVAATAVRCPVEEMFDVATLTCINWANWTWTWECNPPSVS